nr:AAA family ATPase [Halorhabdus sp. BNX81]
MSEVPLPLDRFSGEAYFTALEDLATRYTKEEEPVHYKKAAINQSDATTSSCLKFFSDIGLIEAEKAGVYVPSSHVIDFFRKIGESKAAAQEEIQNSLADYDVFSELLFLVRSGEFTKEELSKKIAGQLDIDKENISSISTAIDIFKFFGFIEISDEGLVRDSSINTRKSDAIKAEEGVESNDSESVQQALPADSSPEDMPDIDFPPTRGSPEDLLNIAEILSTGGTHTTEELVEESEFSKRKVQGLTQYGVALGFIEEEDGYQLTDRGYELSFCSDDVERQDWFQEAINQYPSYRHLLQASLKDLENGSDSLESPKIEKELRTTFGFTGNAKDTVRQAINTLLKTVEAAGYGEYIIGRGSNSTRIEAEPKELQSLRSLVANDQPSKENRQSDSQQNGDTDAEQGGDTDTNSFENEDSKKSEQNQVLDDENTKSKSRGPAVRISEIRIQNFRNIRDTGYIELENVTTLIGKNESGKTSTLEAIRSFSTEYDYIERDLSTAVTIADTEEKTPIISLRFELEESLVDEFYPDQAKSTEMPLTITRTKYYDNSYEAEIDADINVNQVELPTPNILYYDSYSRISDSATIKQLENGERPTFNNLLDLGRISIDTFEDSSLTRYNAIEQAENRIEDQINEAWSQKSLNFKLDWDSSEEKINLLIQDQLNPDSATDERSLTYPSQRSAGFQWFLSFYINLLAESNSSSLESKVLLLDDPAVYLHPEGKRDWLESVNDIGKDEQVVFSSHSPYLIDKRYPSRIRAVEDTPRGGTKIREDIFQSDNHTLEPLRNALGGPRFVAVHLSSSITGRGAYRVLYRGSRCQLFQPGARQRFVWMEETVRYAGSWSAQCHWASKLAC